MTAQVTCNSGICFKVPLICVLHITEKLFKRVTNLFSVTLILSVLHTFLSRHLSFFNDKGEKKKNSPINISSSKAVAGDAYITSKKTYWIIVIVIICPSTVLLFEKDHYITLKIINIERLLLKNVLKRLRLHLDAPYFHLQKRTKKRRKKVNNANRVEKHFSAID